MRRELGLLSRAVSKLFGNSGNYWIFDLTNVCIKNLEQYSVSTF